MAEREELAEIIARLTPEDASDPALLVEASAHAAAVVTDMLPTLREQADHDVWAQDADNRRAARSGYLVRLVASKARQVRNDYLKEHGAFRG